MKKNSSGFSLLELSIALVIIGLMVSTTITSYSAFVKSRATNFTDASFSSIYVSLTQFQTRYGRLPCPAIMADSPSDSTSGVEKSTCATDAVTGIASGTCTSGYCRLKAVANSDVVLSGAIPYVTLGIPFKNTIDGWGRKLKYVVTARLTRTDTYDSSKPAVNVLDPANNSSLADAPDTMGQLVIISSGPDGVGAYDANGRLVAPCSGAGKDLENCDEPANSTYYGSSPRIEIAGATHYDDKVMERAPPYKIVSDSDRWAYTSTTLSDMQNKGGRRVGIGLTKPENNLHVAGNIKSGSFNADLFCNAGGTVIAANDGPAGQNCIPIGLFGAGGTGTTCSGVGMTSIKSATANCLSAITANSIIGNTCPAGTVMCGVSAARTILCSVPGSTTCP